jgi:hypothetical protein
MIEMTPPPPSSQDVAVSSMFDASGDHGPWVVAQYRTRDNDVQYWTCTVL